MTTRKYWSALAQPIHQVSPIIVHFTQNVGRTLDNSLTAADQFASSIIFHEVVEIEIGFLDYVRKHHPTENVTKLLAILN